MQFSRALLSLNNFLLSCRAIFPYSFRLSVRQVVSRVILRGSALHYFAQRPIWAHGVDGFLAQHGSQLFEGGWLLTAQEDGSIHVADDGICVILIDRLQLTLCLQHQTGGNLTASDGGNQLFQLGDLADVVG